MPDVRVSVIVPTLEEEATIAATLDDLAARRPHEVIVVDGGSRDRTQGLARERARLVQDGPGLARQMNRGARESSGDVLLFHYADLRLPPAAFEAIGRALERPEVAGGAFRLGFDSPRAVYRVIAWASNLRNRLGFGPFGDQAIFVRRSVFEELGGFTEGAPLEDFDLVRRLRRRGRFAILRPPVRSSVRAWERHGIFRTFREHSWASFLYLAGAHGRFGRMRERLIRRR